jgi:hypothetical protein
MSSITFPLSSNTTGPATFPLHEGIINNKQTNAIKGMPFKPNTMEQGASFALGRVAFARAPEQYKLSSKPPTPAQMKSATSGFGGGNGFTGGLITKMGSLGSKSQLVGKGSKNWASSSTRTENLRRMAIGSGSMNALNSGAVQTSLSSQVKTSFSNQNLNDSKDALRKCRSGGCIAPAKKGAVYF